MTPIDRMACVEEGELLSIAAGERAAMERLESWKRTLQEPLIEFYRRLARFSIVVGAQGPEQKALLASMAAEVEGVHQRLERMFSEPAPGAVTPPAPAPEPVQRASDRALVLLIDDDDSTRGSLQELLAASYEVVVATDGIEGARLIRELRPDVVITDLCMPQVDGFALLSTMRQDDELAQIPLLVMSGLVETDAKIRAFDSGAFDYLTKPVAAGEVVARVRNAISRSRDLRRERELQSTDDLTGLANRRSLNAALATALKQAARERTELSVVMLDQDGLKQINDLHGHAAGDAAILALARALSECKRHGDCAARLGGDEFVVVMPGTDRAGAAAFAQRVQEELERAPIQIPTGTLVVRASFGIASVSDVAWEEPADQLLARADAALYQVKRARGRTGARTA